MTGVEAFPGEFQAGDIVGDTYVVLNYLGRGAMGHVYHVRHQMLNAEYALKTISSEKVTEVAWRRFQNEAQAIAMLNHPNVVGIYNLGLHNKSLPYYVMDLLVGLDLAEKIHRDGPLEIKYAAQIFAEVGAGISYAHKKGIVHRDIKPGNIFILAKPGSSGEKIKVVDFGIAKLSETRDPKNQELTGMGDVVGTPYYMSPEQCMGLRVDSRSDIYSLGCTLFEALTGNLPFRGRNPTETMMLHQSTAPPSLQKASGGKAFPDTLEYIVATTLAKEPAERYQTMDQLTRDLATVIEGDKPVPIARGGALIDRAEQPPTLSLTLSAIEKHSGRKWPLIVAPVMAMLLAGGVWAYWQFGLSAKLSANQTVTDHLNNFKPVLSDKVADDGDVQRMILNEQMTDIDVQMTGGQLPPGQTVTASMLVNKPFSTIVDEDGKQFRCFDFPADVVIGLIKSKSQENTMRAMGQLKYPTGQRLFFTPAEIVGRYPTCLKRFRPEEIYGVKFDASACTDQIIKATLNLHGVKKLDFARCKGLTMASVPAIHGFHNLQAFDASNCDLDCRVLARCNCWNSLKELNLAASNHVLPLLEALKNSPDLEHLYLAKCKLSAEEFLAISALRGLKYLDVNGNHMTNSDLSLLTGMDNLTELNLQGTGLDQSAVAVLKQFKSLNKLHIKSKKFKSGQAREIQEALPHVKVI